MKKITTIKNLIQSAQQFENFAEIYRQKAASNELKALLIDGDIEILQGKKADLLASVDDFQRKSSGQMSARVWSLNEAYELFTQDLEGTSEQKDKYWISFLDEQMNSLDEEMNS